MATRQVYMDFYFNFELSMIFKGLIISSDVVEIISHSHKYRDLLKIVDVYVPMYILKQSKVVGVH